MSIRDCPCKHCTPETGRGPGCHTPACPNGWHEWDRTHNAARAEKSKRHGWTDAADSVLIEAAEKRRRKR